MMKLGILGFGVVGKSALAFFHSKRGDERFKALFGSTNYELIVWDQRTLEPYEVDLIKKSDASVVACSDVTQENFFMTCDKVLVSPGFNVRNIPHIENKLICELDVFRLFFDKPTIAVTGSFGKTTITALLGQLLAHKRQVRIAVGGNIGIGMLDLALQADEFDCAVLELSSWQLEYNRYFAPSVGVWTNLHPNHLDRHETLEKYAYAKYALFQQQQTGDHAVLASDLITGVCGKHIKTWFGQQSRSLIVTSTSSISPQVLDPLLPHLKATVWVDAEHHIFLDHYENGVVYSREDLGLFTQLPDSTFGENWMMIIGTLFAAGIEVATLKNMLTHMRTWLKENPYGKHRVEHFATIHDVDFYNDSKSTMVQTTQAAAKKLSCLNRPLIVIVGGLSKGVDRSSLVPYLKSLPSIKKIYSFGAADDLVGCKYFPTLEDVVDDIMNSLQPGDLVLLSPSGASFDLFKNYQHRGEVFKELVLHYNKTV